MFLQSEADEGLEEEEEQKKRVKAITLPQTQQLRIERPFKAFCVS